MRSVVGIWLAVAAVLLTAGCSGDSEATKKAPIGPTLEATLAKHKDRAACAVILRYAESRRNDMLQEVGRLAPPPPPVITDPNEPDSSGKRGASGPGPGVTTAGSKPGSDGAPTAVSTLPPEPESPALIKARALAAQWGGLVASLQGRSLPPGFSNKGWTLGGVKGDLASSQLVVELPSTYRELAPGDLTFEVTWHRIVRPGTFKGAPRADWELGDSRLIAGGNETKPE